MDLIRLLKLKDINGELECLSKQELHFISLFNGLVKYYDFYLYYPNNKDNFKQLLNTYSAMKNIHFEVDLTKNLLRCSYANVIYRMTAEYDITCDDFFFMVLNLFKKLGIDLTSVCGINN